MTTDNHGEHIPSRWSLKLLSTLRTIKERLARKQKEEWNKRLVGKVREFQKIPNLKQIKRLPNVLSRWEKFVIKVLLLLILVSIGLLTIRFYYENTIMVPARGGEYIEGITSEPQLINPVFASKNDADSDLARLIFSGLLEFNEKLELEPDLAVSYEVSDDQLEYTFYLNENVFWHDGEKFDADDVVFTFSIIKDPEYVSPLRANFRGVTIEREDDFTVKFVLKEPYAPFLNSLTFGILPQHQWGEIAPKNFQLSKLNLHPVGTGPFRAVSFKQDDLGTIRSYRLVRNERYHRELPLLEHITFKFYSTQEAVLQALDSKAIMAGSFLPTEVSERKFNAVELTTYSLVLPQYTALFFNLRGSGLLKEKTIRNALAMAVDQETLVNQIFGDDADNIHGPILPGFLGYSEDLQGPAYDASGANTLLDEAGWKRITPEDYFALIQENEAKAQKEIESDSGVSDTAESAVTEGSEEEESAEDAEEKNQDEALLERLREQSFYRRKGDAVLELNITTVDASGNRTVAEAIQEYWNDIGVRVDIFTPAVSKIHTEVIKPRLYNVLLYAEVLGPDPDPYPFWHSSQIPDPGLNLSQFAHNKVDTLLEKARKTSNASEREQAYREFQEILIDEIPAVFLYYPRYTYVLDQQVKNVSVEMINLPSDRFSDIEKRYISTKRVFSFQGWKNFFLD